MRHPTFTAILVLVLAADTAFAQTTQPGVPLPAATPITFKMSDESADAAIGQIVKQTGFAIQPANEYTWQQAILGRVSVDFGKTPFWAAFREVCAKSGVTIYSGYHGERRILLTPSRSSGNNLMKCPASVNGPFIIMVYQIQRQHAIDMANPQVISRSISVQLMGFSEPKLTVVRSGPYPQIELAVDDKGNSLVPPNRAVSRELSPARGLAWTMYANLTPPADAGQKLAKLRGTARIAVQTAAKHAEISDILKARNITREIEGYQITLVQVTNNEGRFTAHILLGRDGLDANLLQQFVQGISCRLTDAQSGREFACTGITHGELRPPRAPITRTATIRPTQIELKLQFSPRETGRRREEPVEPTKLLLDLTTGTQELAIPFEFSDILLP